MISSQSIGVVCLPLRLNVRVVSQQTSNKHFWKEFTTRGAMLSASIHGRSWQTILKKLTELNHRRELLTGQPSARWTGQPLIKGGQGDETMLVLRRVIRLEGINH